MCPLSVPVRDGEMNLGVTSLAGQRPHRPASPDTLEQRDRHRFPWAAMVLGVGKSIAGHHSAPASPIENRENAGTFMRDQAVVLANAVFGALMVAHGVYTRKIQL
jgi:hypothetical protein